MKFAAIIGAVVFAIPAAVCALPFAAWAYVGPPTNGPTIGQHVGFAVVLIVAALIGALPGALFGVGIAWLIRAGRFGRMMFGGFVGLVLGLIAVRALLGLAAAFDPSFPTQQVGPAIIAIGFGIGAVVGAVLPLKKNKPA